MWFLTLVLASLSFVVSFQDAAGISYLPVGCFKDKIKHRLLPELLKNFRKPGFDWYNFNTTIDKCAELAKEKGYLYFGLQFYGECWSGPTAHASFENYGPSKHCLRGVGKHRTNFVYKLTGEENECRDYKLLNSADRSRNYVTSGQAKCDHWNFDFEQHSWFRFDGEAGNAMADTCVQPRRCQTWMTGWLSSPHPKVVDGIQNGQVCFSWANNCCQRPTVIRVRNCGNFYVYFLPSTTGCFLRYCGNGE